MLERTSARWGTKQLRIRQWTWSLASLAVAFVLSHGASLRSESAPPQSWFTLSRETTFFTEPITQDGYADYVAAINAYWSRDLAPEQNAYVALVQILGPRSLRVINIPGSFFTQLGISPLPAEGYYFEPFDYFLTEICKMPIGAVSRLYEQIREALLHPWQV